MMEMMKQYLLDGYMVMVESAYGNEEFFLEDLEDIEDYEMSLKLVDEESKIAYFSLGYSDEE